MEIVNQPTRDDARRATARMEEREIQRDNAVRCGDDGYQVEVITTREKLKAEMASGRIIVRRVNK